MHSQYPVLQLTATKWSFAICSVHLVAASMNAHVCRYACVRVRLGPHIPPARPRRFAKPNHACCCMLMPGAVLLSGSSRPATCMTTTTLQVTPLTAPEAARHRRVPRAAVLARAAGTSAADSHPVATARQRLRTRRMRRRRRRPALSGLGPPAVLRVRVRGAAAPWAWQWRSMRLQWGPAGSQGGQKRRMPPAVWWGMAMEMTASWWLTSGG